MNAAQLGAMVLAPVIFTVAGSSVALGAERHHFPATPVSLLVPNGMLGSDMLIGADGAIIVGAPMFGAEVEQTVEGFRASSALGPEYEFQEVETDAGRFVVGQRLEHDRLSWVTLTPSRPQVMLMFTRPNTQLDSGEPSLDLAKVAEMLGTVEFESPDAFFARRLAERGLALSVLPPFEFQSVGLDATLVMTGTAFVPAKLVKIVVSVPKRLPGESLDELGARYLRTDGDVVSAPAAFAGTDNSVRRSGTWTDIHIRLAFVQYVALVDGGAVVLSASGPVETMTPDLVGIIDGVAATVRTIENKSSKGTQQ